MKWRAKWVYGTRPQSPVFAGYESSKDPAYSNDFNLTSDDPDGGSEIRLIQPTDCCGWYDEAISRLSSFTDLDDDWDGYGAARPTEEVVSAAREYLRRLSQHCDVVRPAITPTRVGGVLLAWKSGPHRLEITFSPSGASFVYLNLNNSETRRGDLARLDDEKLLYRLLKKHFES